MEISATVWACVAGKGLYVLTLHHGLCYCYDVISSICICPVIKVNDFWSLADRCGTFEVCCLPLVVT